MKRIVATMAMSVAGVYAWLHKKPQKVSANDEYRQLYAATHRVGPPDPDEPPFGRMVRRRR